MQIIGAVIFYDDEAELLSECLRSLVGVCDRIICVDGAYDDYPNGTPKSRVSLREIVKSYPVELIDAESRPDLSNGTGRWVDQAAKRNAYLIGNPGDWYINLDADDALVNGHLLRKAIAEKTNEADWFILKYKRPRAMDDIVRAGVDVGYRVFKHVPGLHYDFTHFNLRDVNGTGLAFVSGKEEQTPYVPATIREAWIDHMKDARTSDRLCRQACYYQTRAHA